MTRGSIRQQHVTVSGSVSTVKMSSAGVEIKEVKAKTACTCPDQSLCCSFLQTRMHSAQYSTVNPANIQSKL